MVGRNPLVVIDGAHNLQSLTGLATSLLDEFPPARRVLVVGFGGERDPGTLLEPLLGVVDEVVATSAADGSAIPAEEVAAAATARFGADVPVSAATPAAAAVDAALAAAAPDDQVVVAGSLYVVGEARSALPGRVLKVGSPAHSGCDDAALSDAWSSIQRAGHALFQNPSGDITGLGFRRPPRRRPVRPLLHTSRPVSRGDEWRSNAHT